MGETPSATYVNIVGWQSTSEDTYLIDRRGYLRTIKNLAQLRVSEVRDADAALQPLFLDRLHFLPYGLQAPRLLVELDRRVDEEEVDVIDPQLRERLDERVPHGLAFGRLEHLRRDEQELAGLPRRCDARAQRLLVLVYLCAIEVREAR